MKLPIKKVRKQSVVVAARVDPKDIEVLKEKGFDISEIIRQAVKRAAKMATHLGPKVTDL